MKSGLHGEKPIHTPLSASRHQGKGLRFTGTLSASSCAPLLTPSFGFIFYGQRVSNDPPSSPPPPAIAAHHWTGWLGLLGLITPPSCLSQAVLLGPWLGFSLFWQITLRKPLGAETNCSLVAKGSGGPSIGRHMHSWNAEGSEQPQEWRIPLRDSFSPRPKTHLPIPLSLGLLVLPAGS